MACLPTELLWRVMLEAATDAHTAHMLAHISKEICVLTRAHRWRTIVITTKAALCALLRTLHMVRTAPHEPLSTPGRVPSLETTALYVDTSSEDDVDLLTHLAHLAPEDVAVMVRAEDMLASFPHVDTLSLGSVDLQALAASIDAVAPVSLTLVYDGNETLLSHIFAPRADAPLGALRRRLRYLHVIGISTDTDLTGIPMPLAVLEPLCAGLLCAHSFLDALLTHGSRLDGWEPGVQYLRYDTCKFSYRPTEITASRLRGFCQGIASTDARADMAHLGLAAPCRLALCWQAAHRGRTVERERAAPSMFSGGWVPELRGAWTERGRTHREAHEAFRLEFVDAITERYGWTERTYPEGQYVDRLRRGFSERDVTMLRRLQHHLAARHGVDPSTLAFCVRRPATFLELGQQYAALHPSERLALFLQHIT